MADAKPYPKSMQLGAQRKKYRRRVASRKTWEKLRDERLLGKPCVICWHEGFGVRGAELHHVVPRDRFGDDIPENLVPICNAHHQLVESGSTKARRLLAAAVQQSEPAVYAYAIDKLGEDGFVRLHGIDFKETPDAA